MQLAQLSEGRNCLCSPRSNWIEKMRKCDNFSSVTKIPGELHRMTLHGIAFYCALCNFARAHKNSSPRPREREKQQKTSMSDKQRAEAKIFFFVAASLDWSTASLRGWLVHPRIASAMRESNKRPASIKFHNKIKN
jgi:hypothetical protein